MLNEYDINITPRDWEQDNSIIKVVGVGGGGCNAVNYMFHQGIAGCSFAVCNTNVSSLALYDVPVRIQLGDSGLGAGTDPIVGRNAALESQDAISKVILDTGTKMLFVTAGLGGGTGTGAAPVIARMAKERGILTVAVVTIPFENDGKDSFKKAYDGIQELMQVTDALIVINNEKLYQYYGDLLTFDALSKADEVLSIAVRGIIEIISLTGYIDVDFQDVSNILKDSGMALLGSGEGRGPNRLEDAVKATFESPLLSDYDLTTAKNFLINVTSGKNNQGLMMSELKKLDEMIARYTGKAARFKKGIVCDEDPEFGDKVRITAIVTGCEVDLSSMDRRDAGNIVIIDGDYDWETVSACEKVPDEMLPAHAPGIERVGPTTNSVRNGFSFERKPRLCVKPGEALSELNNVSAFRRKEQPVR